MKTGLSVSKEAMGAFIDAVYAIAVTILALELPRNLESDAELLEVGTLLVNYAISFLVLFALWMQHRRINQHLEDFRHAVLWLNSGILMLVCLIPRATTFVFEYGGNADLRQIEEAAVNFTWTLSTIIDLGFVAIVVLADLGLVALLRLTPERTRHTAAADIYRSKVTISTLLILVMAASLLLPFENRFFLALLPVFLMLEHRIASLVDRFRS